MAIVAVTMAAHTTVIRLHAEVFVGTLYMCVCIYIYIYIYIYSSLPAQSNHTQTHIFKHILCNMYTVYIHTDAHSVVRTNPA